MTDTRHAYMMIQDIGLTAAQRHDLIDALKTIQGQDTTQPAHILHWRQSPDGSRIILEALFDTAVLTVGAIKLFIADSLGVGVGVIDDDLQQTEYGPAVTYSAAGVDRVTFLLFGGLNATWEESRVQAAAYVEAAPWATYQVLLFAPASTAGLPALNGTAHNLIAIGAFRLWEATATEESLLALHDALWELSPFQTLGLLGTVETPGETVLPHAIQLVTGMTAEQALRRRNRVAAYLESLGKDATLLREAIDEQEQIEGIIAALGFTMTQLWNAMDV